MTPSWSDPIEGQGTAHNFAETPELIGTYLGVEHVEVEDKWGPNTTRQQTVHRFTDQQGERMDAWGSADLDAKLRNIVVGTLVRIHFDGTRTLEPKSPGDEPRQMKQFTVQVDTSTIHDAPTAPAGADDDIPF